MLKDYLSTLRENAEIQEAIATMNNSSQKSRKKLQAHKDGFEALAVQHSSDKQAVSRRRNTKRLNDCKVKRDRKKSIKRDAKNQYKEDLQVKSEIESLEAENTRIDCMISEDPAMASESVESLKGLKSENETKIKKLSYSLSRHNK